MKLSLKKIVSVTALAMIGTAAQAEPFYLNLNNSYLPEAGVKVGGVGSTTTGSFNELNIRYNSYTTITDTNGSGVLDTGDAVLGTGGYLKTMPSLVPPPAGPLLNTPDVNYVTGFTPTYSISVPGSPSLNGHGTDWGLTFGWDNLVGTVTSTGGIQYSSGTIHVYLIEPTRFGDTNPHEVVLLNVTSGGNNAIGQSLNLLGTVDVPGAAEVQPDLFNWTSDLSRWFDTPVTITFEANQNTQPFFINGVESSVLNPTTFFNGGTEGVLEATHDGSMSFNRVPEPGSMALLGSALLGLCGLRRRKSA